MGLLDFFFPSSHPVDQARTQGWFLLIYTVVLLAWPPYSTPVWSVPFYLLMFFTLAVFVTVIALQAPVEFEFLRIKMSLKLLLVIDIIALGCTMLASIIAMAVHGGNLQIPAMGLDRESFWFCLLCLPLLLLLFVTRSRLKDLSTGTPSLEKMISVLNISYLALLFFGIIACFYQDGIDWNWLHMISAFNGILLAVFGLMDLKNSGGVLRGSPFLVYFSLYTLCWAAYYYLASAACVYSTVVNPNKFCLEVFNPLSKPARANGFEVFLQGNETPFSAYLAVDFCNIFTSFLLFIMLCSTNAPGLPGCFRTSNKSKVSGETAGVWATAVEQSNGAPAGKVTPNPAAMPSYPPAGHAEAAPQAQPYAQPYPQQPQQQPYPQQPQQQPYDQPYAQQQPHQDYPPQHQPEEAAGAPAFPQPSSPTAEDQVKLNTQSPDV